MHKPGFVLALAIFLALRAPLSADPTDDENLLRKAGLPTDGPALLKFLRSFIPTGDPDAVAPLIRQLGAEDFSEREAAVAKLIALGPTAAPLLRQALRDPDRERALRAEACLRLIDNGPGTGVHAAALRLVAHHKVPGAAAVLLEYLPFAPTEVLGEEAGIALAAVTEVDGKIDPAVVGGLTDDNKLRRIAAAEAISRTSNVQHRADVKRLLADPDDLVRQRVALALAFAKERDAIPVLIDLLDKVAPGRQYAIENVLFRLAGDKAPQSPSRAGWEAWWREHGAKVDLAKLTEAAARVGYTMIVEPGEVREVDHSGKTRWKIDGLQHALFAQMLEGDKVLIVEFKGRRVTERSLDGKILSETSVALPMAAQRLENGNTFIATRNQYMELDRQAQRIYARAFADKLLVCARKLSNGQVVWLNSAGECVRLDAKGKELHRFQVGFRVNFGSGIDVTPRGGLLIPDATRNRIIEFDENGKVRREYDAPSPDSVQRLPSGNLLVASQTGRRVVELDVQGRVVWEHRCEGRPVLAVGR